MIYGTVCSGIEAPSVAWHPLGWKPAFFSEIEAFPRAVLAERWPDVPIHGDFTTIRGDEYGAVDLLCAGTPCQDFSVAGLRAGLVGDRGALTLQFAALALRLHPEWIVWENVPGVLSVDRGFAFRRFLDLLGECGYGWAYRILDAQHFGVPQRRRRVFVVGHLGDWRPAAAVLFEPESLCRDTPPRRAPGKRVADCLAPGAGGGRGHRYRQGGINNLSANTIDTSPRTRQRCDASDNLIIAGTVRSHPRPGSNSFGSLSFNWQDDRSFVASEDTTNPLRANQTEAVAFAQNSRQELRLESGDGSVVGSLSTAGGKPDQGYPAIAIQYAEQLGREKRQNGIGIGDECDPMFTLETRQPHGIGTSSGVRRLTPRECERLQGFPDNYTLISLTRSQKRRVDAEMAAYYRRTQPELSDEIVASLAADGPRYRALGNSMAVPCVRWLGERIQMVD